MSADEASFLRSSDLDPAALERRARQAMADSPEPAAPGREPDQAPADPERIDPARIAERYERPATEPKRLS